jgi:hypothetical protein
MGTGQNQQICEKVQSLLLWTPLVRVLDLSSSVRLGEKGLPSANTLAYLCRKSGVKKRFNNVVVWSALFDFYTLVYVEQDLKFLQTEE